MKSNLLLLNGFGDPANGADGFSPADDNPLN